MNGIRIIVNEQLAPFTAKKMEENEGVSLSILRMGKMRLQKVAEEENIDKLIEAIHIEREILGYAAELYAAANQEEIFDNITECIEEYIRIEDELLALKG